MTTEKAIEFLTRVIVSPTPNTDTAIQMAIDALREQEKHMGVKRFETINIILDNDALMPLHGHDLDAGYDLRTPKDFTIKPGGSAVIDVGVHFQIPAGWYGKLESKSGLNVNHGIVSLGGIIDSGYTGSVVTKIYNFGKEPYSFRRGDKIVQIIFHPHATPRMLHVFYFESTERGNSGFGSTGR